LIDSTDDFFFRIDGIKRRDDDVKARREIDDEDSMRNAKIDRSDDSMNDLSEIDRRDFSSRKDFIDESHLMN
jgi:hypothetical protein